MNGLMKTVLGAAVMGCVVATSAQTKFPLKVDIDVSTKSDMTNIGAGSEGQARVDHVQVVVKVHKSGGQPYTDPLTLELYVIGKQIQTGYYGIIDVVKQEFTFSKDEDNSYSYASKTYQLPQTSGNINVGGTYETYLVVVVDKNGKIIDTRSGRVIKQRGIDFIRELGPMTLFDRDGNVLGKVENPGEAFKKAVPAAVITVEQN
ncbi:MAG: hypothetical protein K9M54_07270 [Kiritimatiellales bacterium]|nr:hypothetical protein [Kiritimatiellales bacterium]MCF7863651.1 hypothetical protein [Kiritimatiellales bacterium]